MVTKAVGLVGPSPEATIEEAFWRFHRENPHVYHELVRLARAWRQRRSQKVGVGMLFEVLRWQMAMRTTGDTFKLNNNFRSYYARLIMAEERDLEGIFDTRSLRAPDPFVKPAPIATHDTG
jgi:hypothetical protein